MTDFFDNFEEAIKNGDSFYWDQESIKNGKSAGSRCPICKKWTQLPRKRKTDLPVFISECDNCEIKDDLLRSFHKLNKCINNDERIVINTWHSKLWSLGDKLRDLTRQPDYFGTFRGKLGDSLMDLLAKMPWLEK